MSRSIAGSLPDCLIGAQFIAYLHQPLPKSILPAAVLGRRLGAREIVRAVTIRAKEQVGYPGPRTAPSRHP